MHVHTCVCIEHILQCPIYRGCEYVKAASKAVKSVRLEGTNQPCLLPVKSEPAWLEHVYSWVHWEGKGRRFGGNSATEKLLATALSYGDPLGFLDAEETSWKIVPVLFSPSVL